MSTTKFINKTKDRVALDNRPVFFSAYIKPITLYVNW